MRAAVAILAAAVALVPVIGRAQSPPPALHDKAWYAANQAARLATLKFCHADATRADWFDCQNAEAADAGTIGRPQPQRSLDAYLNDPQYWANNPVPRKGAEVQCARRWPSDAMVLPYCNAIQAGERLATSQARRP